MADSLGLGGFRSKIRPLYRQFRTSLSKGIYNCTSLVRQSDHWTIRLWVGYPFPMFEKINLDDLSKRLSKAVPSRLSGLGSDLEKNFHAILQGALDKMNLVTREEFDVQRAVLAKTREKLEKLEARAAELEQRILNK